VELGRLQLELALQQTSQSADSKWALPVADPTELSGMAIAERYSNVLHNKDPANLFSPPAMADGDTMPAVGATSTVPDELPFEEIGKSTLCEALKAALAARDFTAARRAARVLALSAYGLQCPEASFEFLVWLQSTTVCIRAEEIFRELQPEDHQERVQTHLLRSLEKRWPLPQALDTYTSTVKRLQAESPLFQRLQISDLPPISELVLSSLPPLTLVVTLQMHDHHLYVGAACSPGEGGDAQQRLQQLRYMVTRVEVRAPELHKCMTQLQELNLRIEKELITHPGIPEDLCEKYASLVSQAEACLAEPVARELARCFWTYGVHAAHPMNPQQLMLLPDSTLWGLPLERFTSFIDLFAIDKHSAISRDYSLHVAAQRVRKFVEEGKPLKVPIPAAKGNTTALLTDTFNEDTLRPSENPRSETMSALHKRLVETKVIGNEQKSLHGGMFAASGQDIKTLLADSTAFYSLGFGRFFTAISARQFASQDLRHVALMGTFHRCLNDGAFRRQTKTDSMKTLRQLTIENAYGSPLIAAFRGVQCYVLATVPTPIASLTKSFEVFAKAVQAGKTVAKAVEEILLQEVQDPELRSCRKLEGGEEPVRSKEQEENGSGPQPLLLPHSRSAFVVVGTPWTCSEAGDAGGKKK